MLSVAPKNGPDGQVQLHASTVVVNGRAVAITGPSGAGKSAFALALIARGATLLADDITWLERQGGVIVAHCPAALAGRIEARGIGILETHAAPPTPLHAIVDLGTPETARLPVRKSIILLGVDIRVFHSPAMSHFIDAIMIYMKHDTPERHEVPDAR